MADGAVDDEILIREQSVPLSEKLECEVEVTPSRQFSRVHVPASQSTVFRLRGGEHVGLVFWLKDEELFAIVLQELHHQVMADLRSGTSSEDLMKKYRLNAEGLQNLFQELDRSGLLRGTAEQNGVPSKVVINIHQIAEDIKSGLKKRQLMRKYHLSQRGMRWVAMTLVSSGTVTWEEIYDKLFTTHEKLVPDRLRRTKRYPLPFECPVYEVDNPGAVGRVRDISEKGLGIVGLKADLDDERTLVIQEDEFGEFTSFAFDSTCRWITKDPKGVFVAGFEISYISIGNLKEFQLLLHLAELRNSDKQFSERGAFWQKGGRENCL